jgi:hypothetical protein
LQREVPGQVRREIDPADGVDPPGVSKKLSTTPFIVFRTTDGGSSL